MKISDYLVEPARVEDSTNLYNLLESVYSQSNGFCQTFEEKYKSPNCVRQEIQSLTSEDIFLIIKVSGVMKGFLSLYSRKPVSLRHIADLSMGIDGSVCNEGLGTALLLAMHEKLGATMVEILSLMVRADNIGAIKLYQKFQFKKIAVLENDTKIGDQYYDGVLMRKFLTE